MLEKDFKEALEKEAEKYGEEWVGGDIIGGWFPAERGFSNGAEWAYTYLQKEGGKDVASENEVTHTKYFGENIARVINTFKSDDNTTALTDNSKLEELPKIRWVKASERLPNFGLEVVAKFNNVDADLGYFNTYTDMECGEETIYFQSNNSDIGRTFINGLEIEWLEELPTLEPEENFFCKEYDKNGYTCEQQCEICAKAENAPDLEPEQGEEEIKHNILTILESCTVWEHTYQGFDYTQATEKIYQLFKNKQP